MSEIFSYLLKEAYPRTVSSISHHLATYPTGPRQAPTPRQIYMSKLGTERGQLINRRLRQNQTCHLHLSAPNSDLIGTSHDNTNVGSGQESRILRPSHFRWTLRVGQRVCSSMVHEYA